MRRLGGQAARKIYVRLWAGLRRLLAVVLGCVVVGGAGFGVLAWWLAQRPIEMPWLAARIEAAGSDAIGSGRVSVAGAALAWEGFRQGVGSPIDIRLADLAWRDPADGVVVEAPRVQVTLELASLLHLRLRPRTVVVRGALVTLTRLIAPAEWRMPAGATPPGPLPPGEGEKAGAVYFSPPLARAVARFSQAAGLTRLVVNGARIATAPGQGWAVPRLDAQFTRKRDGAADASADAALTLGAEPAHASLRATMPPSGDAGLHASLGPVRLASLAALWPALIRVAPILDAPITAEAELALGSDLAPKTGRLDLDAGPGTLRAGDAPVQLLGAHLAASWVPGRLALKGASLDLRPRPDRPGTRVSARGTARIGPEGGVGEVALDLDRLAFDDLAALWPAGLGRDARSWVMENVTAGDAHDGHVALSFAAPSAPSGLGLSGLRLTGATGSVAGSDLTVHWLRPIPPAEHGEAMLRIIDPDSLRIELGTAQQSAPTAGQPGLALQSGSVLVTGLTQPDQFGAIEANVAGPVPAALALLSHPRLELLSKHPVPLKNPHGEMSAEISVSLPLLARVTMDQVKLRTRAHLSALHLDDVVAGRALDGGAFDLSATDDGLGLTGSASVADIPARITGALDFRAGPPSQVQQKITVSGRARSRDLTAAGLDTGGLLVGSTDLTATYTQRRSGDADIEVHAGLDAAELQVTSLGWRKPPGDPATARAKLVLDRAGRLIRVESIEAEGKGIALRGGAMLGAGGDTTLTLDRLVLGGTTARGTIRVLDGGRTVRARLSGPRLDLSGRLARGAGRTGAASPGDEAAGPESDWQLDGSFAQVVLARGRLASALRVRAERAAGVLTSARLSALTGPGQRVEMSVTPDRGGRVVRITAADGGALLRDLGALDSIEGGRMTVRARYQDRRPGRPLEGLAEMDDFKVRGAPVLAKALQAVTLYGLVQAVEGPGMTFTHLAAPFVYDNGVMELDDARAFNPSLGLTAKGQIDLVRDRLDLEGTIVPAYLLNTALGRIPLIGRLFSPEKGGGVIAARYSAQGPLADPAIRVNPLSALTPGFLRGVFGR